MVKRLTVSEASEMAEKYLRKLHSETNTQWERTTVIAIMKEIQERHATILQVLGCDKK